MVAQHSKFPGKNKSVNCLLHKPILWYVNNPSIKLLENAAWGLNLKEKK